MALQKLKDKVDVTCDKCGKMMKPGGKNKKNIGGKDYQFCCDACMNSFDPTKDKEK